MKQASKKMLAVVLAVILCLTTFPLSAFAAPLYGNGQVVEDDGSLLPETPEDDTVSTITLPNGSVVEESDGSSQPSEELPAQPTEGSEEAPPDGEETAGAVLYNQYGEKMGLYEVDEQGNVISSSSARRMARAANKGRKAHFYVTWEQVLGDGANGTSFTILGGAQWENTWPKMVVLLDANGKETNQWAAGYCLDHSLSMPGSSQSERDYLTSDQKTIIGDIMSVGYRQGSGQTISAENRYKWLITQIYIWAAKAGTIRYNSKTGVNELSGKNCKSAEDMLRQIGSLADYVGGGHYLDFYTYAEKMLYNILTLRRRPAFTYATAAEAQERNNAILLTMDESTGLYSAKRCFSNEKITYDPKGLQFWNYGMKDNDFSKAFLSKNYDFLDHGIDGLTAKYRVEANVMENNQYGMEFSVAEEFEGTKVSNQFSRTIVGGGDSCIIFSDGSGYTQNISIFIPASDTINAFYAVKTKENLVDPVSSGIHKEAEDGVVAGIQFTLTGNGKTFTRTTDANGNIDLSDLPLYKQKDVLDDDGNPTGETEDDLDNPITYTVRENVPVRYVTPAEQGCKITPANGEGVTFHNILKKWKVSFTKSDPQATNAQRNRHSGAEGDATLASAEYGLYCNGELIDTFYTDENGQFETWDYYPCGSADGPLNYTIREISPSTGYLLNSEEIALQTDPARYSQEFNTAPAVGGEGRRKSPKT